MCIRDRNKIGDYMAMTSDLGGANIIYPATFNGEQDIYYCLLYTSRCV